MSKYKLIVHYPEDMTELSCRIAKVQAEIVIQHIKQLHISPEDKQRLFQTIIDEQP